MNDFEIKESFELSEIIEPKGENMAEKNKEVVKIDDKTKSIFKKVGFGLVIAGGVLACIGGATLEEVNNGGVLAFGVVEIVGGIIAYIFGK